MNKTTSAAMSKKSKSAVSPSSRVERLESRVKFLEKLLRNLRDILDIQDKTLKDLDGAVSAHHLAIRENTALIHQIVLPAPAQVPPAGEGKEESSVVKHPGETQEVIVDEDHGSKP